MSKVKNNNYYLIQGWMINELQLKGTELQVYAIIYGFSQTEGTYFTGSTAYLEEWTRCTRRSIFNALKSLEEKEYILRTNKKIQGVNNVVYYYANLDKIGYENNSQQAMKNFHSGYENISQLDMKKVHNSCEKISSTHYNNKKINSDIIEDKDKALFREIIDHLNAKANTRFTTKSKLTRERIKARLDEGFTVDDFKKVIDNKVAEWYGTQFQEHLNPDTLFGDKFEKYLNQKISPKQEESKSNVEKYKFVINDFDEGESTDKYEQFFNVF